MSSLLKILSKELHKPALKKFQRRKIETRGIDQIWALDLVDMPSDMTEDNDGYRYILVVVDSFSRFAFGVALQSKSARDTLNALKEIIEESKREPKMLHCDAGKEFVNNEMKKFMTLKGITMYHTYSENKSAIVERFNRTLKGRMWKYFTEHQTHRWIDVLPELLNEYNHGIHRSIGMTPTEASKKENEAELLEKQNSVYPHVRKPVKFKMGDFVRISKVKGIFEKGYEHNWSMEVYSIDQVKLSDPVTYYIKDLKGEEIKGSFYEQELQKTEQALGSAYLIEKILQRKKVKGRKMCLVKWIGYDSSHNSWEPESEVNDVIDV